MYISSHPETSKGPHKIVRRLMGHPINDTNLKKKLV